MIANESLRHRFEQTLVRVAELTADGAFGTAWEVLEHFAAQNAAEDPDASLQCSCRFHQGTLRRLAGDPAGALETFRSVGANPEDRAFYLLTSFCIAELLDQLGDTDAAFRELQRSLDTAGGTPEPTDIGAIALYLGMAGRVHQEVPARHRQLAREVLNACGVILSETDSLDLEKISAAIREAYRKRPNQA